MEPDDDDSANFLSLFKHKSAVDPRGTIYHLFLDIVRLKALLSCVSYHCLRD